MGWASSTERFLLISSIFRILFAHNIEERGQFPVTVLKDITIVNL